MKNYYKMIHNLKRFLYNVKEEVKNMMKMMDRWNQIRDIVNASDYVSVEELVEKTGTSPATIRRDLIQMEQDGMLERIRGGARPTEAHKYKQALYLEKRLEDKKDIKMRICRKAASYIEDGDYIYIDTASTTFFLPDYITAENITVVTNSSILLSKLMAHRIRTYVLNGFIDMESGAIIGENALSRLKTMNFNKIFIGSYGIDEEKGFTTYGTAEGDIKKQLIAQSRQTFVLADASKFGVSAFYTFGTLDAATIITDDCPASIRRRGNIILAEE